MSGHRELILGGPGCGKTTKLIDIVEFHLRQGVGSNEVAYVAFTKKAAAEAKQRACYQLGLREDDLPYFRTLHSFAFKELNISREELMTSYHYQELGEILKVKFGAVEDDFGIAAEQAERGSQLYHIEQQARLRLMSLKEMSLKDGRQGHWLVENYQKVLNDFKSRKRIMDYTDILEIWCQNINPLPIKVLIVDEAQDLSPLQWKIVEQLSEGVPFVYFAGDDDQAIYQWAGADVNYFLGLQAKQTVLPVSHRLPSEVFIRCDRIAKRIKHRFKKDWKPTGRKGNVAVVSSPEYAPLREGQWMVLARNHYHLEATAAFLRTKGYVFTFSGKSSVSSPDALAVRAWMRSQLCELISAGDLKRIVAKFPAEILKVQKDEIAKIPDDITVPRQVLYDSYGIDLDKDWKDTLVLRSEEKVYLKMALEMEQDLDAPPRIKISTIHAVKGGECENVLLLPDMSTASHDSFLKCPDDESRCFYVGASRAKEQLVICQPETAKYFPL